MIEIKITGETTEELLSGVSELYYVLAKPALNSALKDFSEV